jgi:hypothetical protein
LSRISAFATSAGSLSFAFFGVALSINAPSAVGSGIATAAGDAAKPQSTVMASVRIMRR